MADQTTIVVDKVNRNTMKSSKTGVEFTAIELIAKNGDVFTGYENNLPTDGVTINDSLDVTYQQINKKDGSVFNKILGLQKSTTQQAIKEKGSINNTTSSKTSLKGAKLVSSYDNKGARVGGVLHDAVAICIHDAGQGSTVNLSDVESVAKTLLNIANRLG